ncbi:hypothetical protein BN1723_019036 [Verticillium longisporum]|uniref:Uncharacterized protein n=1 Tax=Verticillium longisporum TaxID=100787 RepID=A0A0G4N627_VERLO|nr:hypothetical protein BN1708_018486 [Verticillium longisporum]CRK40262.1 hypothetical protein BN1723_015691 [Verticillium longisporum]CRK41922.1 hypothetical protein BN1723_015995 [Verticillium longisporum]CRK42680.1 hypothetical protein BN1723_019036 [Verticillium longisporum]
MAAQPDFRQVAGAFTTLAEQSALLPNLPAVNGGGELLGLMQEMRREMTRLATAVGRIETRLSAVEATLGSLGERLAAESANNLARSLNGAANGQVLQPLRSLVTGRFVESFPRTLAELGDMNGRALTVLLEELGYSFEGSTAEKRRYLKHLCGVVTELV